MAMINRLKRRVEILEKRAVGQSALCGLMASAVLAVHAGEWKPNEHYLEAYARALGYRSRAEWRSAPVDEVQTRERAEIARLVEKLNAQTSSSHGADDSVRILFESVPSEIKASCSVWLDPRDARL